MNPGQTCRRPPEGSEFRTIPSGPLGLTAGMPHGREPVLERPHFPSGPVERRVGAQLEQEHVTIFHVVGRDLDHYLRRLNSI